MATPLVGQRGEEDCLGSIKRPSGKDDRLLWLCQVCVPQLFKWTTCSQFGAGTSTAPIAPSSNSQYHDEAPHSASIRWRGSRGCSPRARTRRRSPGRSENALSRTCSPLMMVLPDRSRKDATPSSSTAPRTLSAALACASEPTTGLEACAGRCLRTFMDGQVGPRTLSSNITQYQRLQSQLFDSASTPAPLFFTPSKDSDTGQKLTFRVYDHVFAALPMRYLRIQCL